MVACSIVFIIALTLLEVLAISTPKHDASSPKMDPYPAPWLIRNSKLNTSSNSAWVTCNIPPRYPIPVTIQDCSILYYRYAALANFHQRRLMHGSIIPRTLGEEDDVCVMRLENYNRRQIDIFSDFDIFSAMFRVLGQCILGYGGAASVGLMNFHVSVAGSIPILQSAAEGENVTSSLSSSQPVAATLEPPDTA